MGYGVMVTLQILVLSFLVRVRVSQLRASFFLEKCFFVLYDLAIPRVNGKRDQMGQRIFPVGNTVC